MKNCIFHKWVVVRSAPKVLVETGENPFEALSEQPEIACLSWFDYYNDRVCMRCGKVDNVIMPKLQQVKDKLDSAERERQKAIKLFNENNINTAN